MAHAATVVFVSHNLNLVSQLCQKAMVLERGQMKCFGPSTDAMRMYSESGHLNLGEAILRDSTEPVRPDGGFIRSVRTSRPDGSPSSAFFIGEPIVIHAEIVTGPLIKDIQLSFIIRNGAGIGIAHCMSLDDVPSFRVKGGVAEVSITIRDSIFYPGDYVIDELWMAMASTDTLDITGACLGFTVLDGGPVVKRPLPRHAALVYVPTKWTCVAKEHVVPAPQSLA